MARGYVEVYEGRGKQPFRFRVCSSNGAVVAQSEGYSIKSNCRRAARRFVGLQLGRVIDLTKSAIKAVVVRG